MTISYTDQLYDPVYNTFGVPATLGEETLTVRDLTRGIDLQGNAVIETVSPACKVRMSELTAKGIELSSLPQSTITFNGNTWRIKSFRPKPSPNGESEGQVLLILLSEG